MTTPKSPADIIAAATTAMNSTLVTMDKTIATGTNPPPVAEVAKSYQFPSAPTTFEFTHNSRRVSIPDGVLAVTDPKDIAELEACVRAGIVYGYIDATVTPFAAPPAPLNPNITN